MTSVEQKSGYTVQGYFQSDFATVCNYCKGKGHWKAECPKAMVRQGDSRGQPNSGVCAVSVAPVSLVPATQLCHPLAVRVWRWTRFFCVHS